jgi:Dyggve-Melchior-Clausen syndrome protein
MLPTQHSFQTARNIDERSDLVSLLFQTTGPSHIPRHDELYQDLLSHYNVWIHIADGVDSSSQAVTRACQLTIQHAPRTSNLASLVWNITQILQQVVASRSTTSSDNNTTTTTIDSFSYVAKARSIAGSLRLARLLLHAVIGSYVSSPQQRSWSSTTSSLLLTHRGRNRPSSSPMNHHHHHAVDDRLQQALTYHCRTNDTETDVGPIFVNALVDYLAFTARHSYHQEYDYDARCETIQLMLVLLSTQLYSPLQTSFGGGSGSSVGGVAAESTTTADSSSSSHHHHHHDQDKYCDHDDDGLAPPRPRRYSFWKMMLSRGDITLVLLNITVDRPMPSIRSIRYTLLKQAGRQQSGLSSTTSLLFWLPYRLVSLALSLWRSSVAVDTGDDALSTASSFHGHHRSNGEAAAMMDVSPLADLATLLLLVLTNAKRALPHQIRQTLAAVMDSRYSTDTKYRINYEGWFDSFERTLQHPAPALWFYTVLQGSPTFHEYLTLRSDLDRLVLPLLQTTSRDRFHLYMILILLLLFSQETSFGNDAFRRIQVDDFNLGTVILLAVIDLMESYADDEFLTANCHAVVTNLAASAVDLPGTEESLLRHANLLETAIHRGNPEFVLELMKRLDVQRRQPPNNNMSSELNWLKKRDVNRLEYVCQGLDLRHEKKEVVLQAIATRLKDGEATTETFTYQEEEDPEIFFVPYVWQVVVESSLTDIPWDRKRIKVYEGATSEKGTTTQSVSQYSNDVESIV